MRRVITLLAVATSLLLVVTAVPAMAAKGGNKPDKPGKPPPEQPPGVTCTWNETGVEWDDPSWEGNNPHLRTDDFTYQLTEGVNEDMCLDILTDTAGQWHLTFDGSLRNATIVPRDAFAPGDSCGGEIRRGRTVYDPWTFPHPDDTRTWFPTDEFGNKLIPAATVNACAGDAAFDSNGDGAVAWDDRLTASEWGGFGEWFDWDGDGEVDFDPQYDENGDLLYPSEKVMTFSNEPHPLVLLVFTQGLKGTVDVCVDLPPYDAFCPLEP